jgi:hypothetical protein
MAWTIKTARAATFTGYLFHTQLINRAAQVGNLSEVEQITTGGEYWLDNQEEYINGSGPLKARLAGLSFGDSPGFKCEEESDLIDVVDDYRAYFRFLPDPKSTSIPVTVGITTWGWSARAEKSNGIWSCTRTNVTPPAFTNDHQFPEWTTNYFNNL